MTGVFRTVPYCHPGCSSAGNTCLCLLKSTGIPSDWSRRATEETRPGARGSLLPSGTVRIYSISSLTCNLRGQLAFWTYQLYQPDACLLADPLQLLSALSRQGGSIVGGGVVFPMRALNWRCSLMHCRTRSLALIKCDPCVSEPLSH